MAVERTCENVEYQYCKRACHNFLFLCHLLSYNSGNENTHLHCSALLYSKLNLIEKELNTALSATEKMSQRRHGFSPYFR